MSNHRRKRHYRKAVIAGALIAAVGVPSVAMACIDGQNDGDHRNARWTNASSAHHRWAKGSWSPKPTKTASRTPAGTPAATPSAKPSAKPATTTPSSAASASGTAARVVQLVNSERGKVGCAPLTVNAKLTQAAQAHSEDMAAHRTMSHTGSDGSSPGERITAAGYAWQTYGENVAYGYTTPESVMTGWMNSPGHRANILNCAFKEIGVGYAQPDNYWTQDFAAAR